jgi:transposase InsO family protein
LDTTKIAPGIIQYTAVDDCSRFRLLAVFSRRTGANTRLFLDQVVEEMPFPIQRIQTDRDREFFVVKIQKKMMEYGIKFRPNKPASPHRNGKVERSQRTDKEEFYSTVELDLDLEILKNAVSEWQFYYNWQRTHASLNGLTPMEKVILLAEKTPFHQEVGDAYIVENERIKDANYHVDLKLIKLKGCV